MDILSMYLNTFSYSGKQFIFEKQMLEYKK